MKEIQKWKRMNENEWKNERKWKRMKENERKWKKMKREWKNMKEHERKERKMKENERKWRKMKEDERKRKNMKEKLAFFFFLKKYEIAAKKGNPECLISWGKTRKCRKDKKWTIQECTLLPRENRGAALEGVVFSGPECLFRMFIIPWGIRRAARAAPFFPKAKSKLFKNVHYSCGKKESHLRETCEGLARDLNLEKRKVIIEVKWREKRLDWGASAVSSRALNWRIWYEGKTWPTRRPPYTTLNLIITRMCTIPKGKVTTSQCKANKASSECALSLKESWNAATDFEHPEEEKRETKWERKKLFF